MKSENLLAIVDFLYYGKVNVYQQNLDSFLVIAEELQLKGLMEKMDENIVDVETMKQESEVTEPSILSDGAQTKRTFQNRQNKNQTETNITVALSMHFSGN